MNCPKCGSSDISIGYTCPPVYRCLECRASLQDENYPGIQVLDIATAKATRPAFYGLHACRDCGHVEHLGYCVTCPICKKEEAEKTRVVKLVLTE